MTPIKLTATGNNSKSSVIEIFKKTINMINDPLYFFTSLEHLSLECLDGSYSVLGFH